MRLWLFLRLWSLAWHLGLPVVLVYLWRRGRKDPLYFQHLGERFGRYRPRRLGAVWVHAVSLGELRSAVPLIRALLDRGEDVVTTHFTPAGRREAERVFSAEIAEGRLAAVWVPFETSWAYGGFFRAFRPKLGLVMEIEIWPRMIFAARKAGVPLFMCNAQYPSRSMERDAKIGLRHDLMRGYTGAIVKSELQARRFASVGVQTIMVTGELRFDQPIPTQQVQAAARLRPQIARDRPVIAVASATAPERALFLQTVHDLVRSPQAPLIVFVPRAPELFDDWHQGLCNLGLRVARRSLTLDASLSAQDPGQPEVLLGDSLGEMYFYLALADRVIVGGGFQPKGSHNISEALVLGKPVILGPYLHTIEYPAAEALEAGVAVQTNADRLSRDALDWPGPDAAQMAAFVTGHSGATRRTLAALEPWLKP